MSGPDWTCFKTISKSTIQIQICQIESSVTKRGYLMWWCAWWLRSCSCISEHKSPSRWSLIPRAWCCHFKSKKMLPPSCLMAPRTACWVTISEAVTKYQRLAWSFWALRAYCRNMMAVSSCRRMCWTSKSRRWSWRSFNGYQRACEPPSRWTEQRISCPMPQASCLALNQLLTSTNCATEVDHHLVHRRCWAYRSRGLWKTTWYRCRTR